MRPPRRGIVRSQGVVAGLIEETGTAYRFTYNKEYLADPQAPAVSLTLPKRSDPYESNHLFAFFFGLLAEGTTKDLQCKLLKLDQEDHFGRLLYTLGGDVIGSVTVTPEGDEGDDERAKQS